MTIKTEEEKTVTLTARETTEAVALASRFACNDMKKTCSGFSDLMAAGYMLQAAQKAAQIAGMLTEMYFGG